MVSVGYSSFVGSLDISSLTRSLTMDPSRFCACIRRDPQEEYLRLSIGILYTFLDWVLNLRRGKDGRRLPGIKRKSSLETFWKVFRLVYERATSSKIEKPMNRQMHRV